MISDVCSQSYYTTSSSASFVGNSLVTRKLGLASDLLPSSSCSSPGSSFNVDDSEKKSNLSLLFRHSSCSSLNAEYTMDQQKIPLKHCSVSSLPADTDFFTPSGRRVSMDITDLVELFRPKRNQKLSEMRAVSGEVKRSGSRKFDEQISSTNEHSQSATDPGSDHCSTVRSSSSSGPSSPLLIHLVQSSRVEHIKRENRNDLENEVAHEKLVTLSQQVSKGFDDFRISEGRIRERSESISEPISVFTNVYHHGSTPSPSYYADQQKQCYSPSTQAIVPSNAYSPCSSPNTARSRSPLTTRQSMKRRLLSSPSTDGDDDFPYLSKRPSYAIHGTASPLAFDRSYSICEYNATLQPSRLNIVCPGRMLVDPALQKNIDKAQEMEVECAGIMSENVVQKINEQFIEAKSNGDVISLKMNQQQSACSHVETEGKKCDEDVTMPLET